MIKSSVFKKIFYFFKKLLLFSFIYGIIRLLQLFCINIFLERYRSGHNGADSKSVCAQAHEGSNPSLSAKKQEASSFEGALLLFRENINGIRTQ